MQPTALLLVGFGGPEAPEEVLPFLRRVTAGKNIPDERLVEVGAHYEHFGGVSPINAFHRELLDRLRPRLAQRYPDIRLYWGNRNTPPFIADAVGEMAEQGVRSALAFVTSAYSSYSGCRQYRENLIEGIAEAGADGIELTKLRPYFDHPVLADIWTDRVAEGIEALRAEAPQGPVLVLYSTHSIPTAAAQKAGPGGTGAYVAQHRALAAQITSRVQTGLPEGSTWDLCFQSRSGPPQQPWLEPDVSDRLAEAKAQGYAGVVLVPLGFLSDHIEVLWDLDTVALADARELDLPCVRVPTPGTDDRFIDLVLDLLGEAIDGKRPEAVTNAGPTAWPCAQNCCMPARPGARLPA